MQNDSIHTPSIGRWSLILAALALLAFAPAPCAAQMVTEGSPLPSVGSGVDIAPVAALASAESGSLPAPPMPAPVNNSLMVDKTFLSFNFNNNATETGFYFIPPDPIGAASMNRLLAVGNVLIELRTKEGDLMWRDDLKDFFAPLTIAQIPFDPKVIYDPYELRFVVVALVRAGSAVADPSNVSRILLAVSRGDNPKTPTSNDWYFHSIDAKHVVSGNEVWADYPGFELDEEALYVTANLFTFSGGSYRGSRVWIVDKGVASGFYAAGAASAARYNPYATAGLATTTMPAEIHGGGEPGIGTYLVSYSGLNDGTNSYVQVVTIRDPLARAGGPFFQQEFVFAGQIESLAGGLLNAPQFGGPALISVNDRRALDAVWRNGSLYVTTTIRALAAPDTGQTTAHWFQLDTTAVPTGGLIALADQGNIGGEDIAPGAYTYFPAVAVNRLGEVKFGFSASPPSIYAGAFVTGRLLMDAPGTVQPSETIRAGEDYYLRTFGSGRNRWGDYSGIALDPSNEEMCWVFNEYAAVQGNPSSSGEAGRWGTVWGRAKFRSK